MDQCIVFAYANLDADTRTVVQQEDQAFDRNMHAAGASFMHACYNLRRIHEALRYQRPGFDAYCASKPGLSKSTAYRMLEVANMFPNLGDIQAAPSALYVLAAPSTPEPARQEALSRAEAGEAITHQVTRALVRQHTAPPAPEVATHDDTPGEPITHHLARALVRQHTQPADPHVAAPPESTVVPQADTMRGAAAARPPVRDQDSATSVAPRPLTVQPPAMDTPAPTDHWDWPDDATTIDPDAPASASDDAWAWDTPTTLTDIERRAAPYGLLVDPHPDGVILRWFEEDLTTLAVLTLADAACWLDEQADDLAAHRAARAAEAGALPDDYLHLARAVLDTDRAPQATLPPTLHNPSILTPEADDVQRIVDQLLTAAASMSAPAAAVLLPVATAAPWFHALAERATLCFVRADMDASAGGLIAYLGPDTARFAAIFGAVGVVVRRIAP
jgi:hypothetical protein